MPVPGRSPLARLIGVRETVPRKWAVGLTVFAIFALLLAYTWLSWRQHQQFPDDTTIPSWTQLYEGVVRTLTPHHRSGEIWLLEDARATLGRLGAGLGLGVLGAVLLGLHMGAFPIIEWLFIAPMNLFAKVPPTAALAVFFVLLGTESEFYIGMIAFGVLPTLAQSVYLAVKEIPMERIYKGQMLGASRFEMVWNIIFPEVLPKVLDGVRLQIGPAMVFLIAAEMLLGDVGFGYRIRLQMRLLNMNIVYPYLVWLAAFGFGADALLRVLQRRIGGWSGKGL